MDSDNDEYFFTGIPATPESLYTILIFFLALFLVGDCFCSRVLKIVPPLVGYILVGIAFGPEGWNLLGSSSSSNNNHNNDCNGAMETLVVLGNIGLVLLIVQAGLEMDYEVLQKVGLRGVVIAVVGTILPVTIGTAIASRYLGDWKSALAAGCSFGPTSAGIAMNVLGGCNILPKKNDGNDNSDNNDDEPHDETILHLPVGQLIVAAAIVDDILALVVLSQLEALTVDDTVDQNRALDMVIPIISALVWLVVGGGIALLVFPKIFAAVVAHTGMDNSSGSLSLAVLLGIVFLLLPSTYFSRASYLLGAFLSGLTFCRDSSGVTEVFRQEFQRLIDYGMKLFFAASIGFQVPVSSFGNFSIIGRGFFFALALMGKLAVGLLTPNFKSTEIKKNRVRDSLVVGFSMMGEAEFAFVVAVFGVTEGLVPPDIYASIVWAILLSTVISPLLLKSTLTFLPFREAIIDDSRGLEKKEDDNEGSTNEIAA